MKCNEGSLLCVTDLSENCNAQAEAVVCRKDIFAESEVVEGLGMEG